MDYYTSMDYIVGFLFGYFLKEMWAILKYLALKPQQRVVIDEWDWIHYQEDDLP